MISHPPHNPVSLGSYFHDNKHVLLQSLEIKEESTRESIIEQIEYNTNYQLLY